MEHETNATLEQGIRIQPQVETKTTTETNNSKIQNTKAENVLGTLASIILWIGIIVFVIAFITGFVLWTSNIGYYFGKAERSIGLTLMGSSVVLFLTTLVSWACLKMMVNISRNIFVIKETLLEKKGEESNK